MPKFSIEEHEKRMRELLKPRPLVGQRPNVLESLLERAKVKKIKPKPIEGEQQV